MQGKAHTSPQPLTRGVRGPSGYVLVADNGRTIPGPAGWSSVTRQAAGLFRPHRRSGCTATLRVESYPSALCVQPPKESPCAAVLALPVCCARARPSGRLRMCPGWQHPAYRHVRTVCSAAACWRPRGRPRLATISAASCELRRRQHHVLHLSKRACKMLSCCSASAASSTFSHLNYRDEVECNHIEAFPCCCGMQPIKYAMPPLTTSAIHSIPKGNHCDALAMHCCDALAVLLYAPCPIVPHKAAKNINRYWSPLGCVRHWHP
jgi:hypothetical protein